MTDEQLAEGRRLESAASSSWYIKETRSAGDRAAYLLSPVFTFGGCWTEADAKLAIWLRNNAPALLAAAEREKRAMRLLQSLVYVCHVNDDGESVISEALGLLREAGRLEGGEQP